MATNEWYVRIGNDKIRGPFSSTQIKRFAEEKKIRETTPVRLGEEGAWHHAGRVKGLDFPTHRPAAEEPVVKTRTVSQKASLPRSRQDTTECQFCGEQLLFDDKCRNCGQELPSRPKPAPDLTQVSANVNVANAKQSVSRPSVEVAATSPSNDSIVGLSRTQAAASWVSAIALLVLAISPFFNWVKIGAGGVPSVRGDGRILLALTVIAGIAYVWALVDQRRLTSVALTIQCAATLVVFWMGSLLWRIGALAGASDDVSNGFALVMATMLVSPGTGLYLGFVSSIVVTGALGFISFQRMLPKGNAKLFFLAQGISLCCGLLVALLIGPHQQMGNEMDRGSLITDTTHGEDAREEVTEARLGETFLLSNLEITPKTIHFEALKEQTFDSTETRQTKSFVLTFEAKNVSDGQVFSPWSGSTVVDNFGNECSDPTDTPLSFRSTFIEGNESLKKLAPNETAKVKVAFDPELKTATEYSWTIRTRVSNQDEYESWRMRFFPDQVSGGRTQ